MKKVLLLALLLCASIASAQHRTILGPGNGGTGDSTLTRNAFLIGDSLSSVKFVLPPIPPNLGGTGISLADSAAFANYIKSIGGGVTSVSGSGGTTGLSLTGGPITTSGTLTLGGILGTANGGTGIPFVDTNAFKAWIAAQSSGGGLDSTQVILNQGTHLQTNSNLGIDGSASIGQNLFIGALSGTTNGPGGYEMTLGIIDSAFGNYGTLAMGALCNSYTGSIAAGYQCTSGGGGNGLSLTMGLQCYALQTSIAVGTNDSAMVGADEQAFGTNNQALGQSSAVFGANSVAAGNVSFVAGTQDTGGTNCTALGNFASSAGHVNSFVAGDGLVTTDNDTDYQFKARYSGGFKLQANTGSTTDLTVTSGLAVLSGALQLGSKSDASAPNGSLFLGSDHSNHLCFKTAGGSVHDFGF